MYPLKYPTIQKSILTQSQDIPCIEKTLKFITLYLFYNFSVWKIGVDLITPVVGQITPSQEVGGTIGKENFCVT